MGCNSSAGAGFVSPRLSWGSLRRTMPAAEMSRKLQVSKAWHRHATSIESQVLSYE